MFSKPSHFASDTYIGDQRLYILAVLVCHPRRSEIKKHIMITSQVT